MPGVACPAKMRRGVRPDAPTITPFVLLTPYAFISSETPFNPKPSRVSFKGIPF